jgi:O-antigen/teichoic acid export membrane protein
VSFEELVKMVLDMNLSRQIKKLVQVYMEKIRYKAISGIKWTGLYTFINGLLNGVVVIVLGIYLPSNEMGLKSIVTVLIGLSMNLAQFGISQAIVQKKEINNEEISSLFWTNILIGLISFFIIFFSATAVGNFYNDTRLVKLIKLCSIIFLLEPISLIYRALLEKELEFKFLSTINIIRISLSSTVTVILVIIYDQGATSYVIGYIIGLISMLLLLIFHYNRQTNIRVGLHFSIKEIKPYYYFGIYVTGKSLLNYFSKNFDELIIGKLLGLEALGVYHLAKQVIDKFIELITFAFSKVFYPLFCKLKNSGIIVLKNTYLKLTHIVVILAFPVFINLFMLLPEIIQQLGFDYNKWKSSVPLMQIFAVKGLFDILSAGFASSVLYANNMPKLLFKVDLYLFPVRLITLFLASFYNIYIVGLSYLLFVIIKVIILQNLVNRILNMSFKEYFYNINRLIYINVLILSVIYIIKKLVYIDTYFIFYSIIIYLILYLFLLYKKLPESFNLIKRNINSIITTR